MLVMRPATWGRPWAPATAPGASPAGPWTYQGDVGSVPGRPFDAHSADNYVTKAQGSAAFTVGGQTVWLGNQWNSGLSQSPPGPRNHDLLYWALLEFDEKGAVQQLTRQPNVTLVFHVSRRPIDGFLARIHFIRRACSEDSHSARPASKRRQPSGGRRLDAALVGAAADVEEAVHPPERRP